MSLVSAPIPIRALLSLAPLVLAACGYTPTSNSSGNQPPPTAQTNDINIVQGASTRTTTAYSPNPKNISLGGASSVTVRWINRDISGSDYTQGTATVHSIVSDNGAFANSASLGGNAAYSVALSAGSYAFHCGQHPGMVGTINVTP
jgi:plastocyanin